MTDEQFGILSDLVIRPLKAKGARVYIFGSRVTGRHHSHSDVDLIYSIEDHLPMGFLSGLKEGIEESRFPFAVDLVRDQDLADSYRRSVESQRVELA